MLPAMRAKYLLGAMILIAGCGRDGTFGDAPRNGAGNRAVDSGFGGESRPDATFSQPDATFGIDAGFPPLPDATIPGDGGSPQDSGLPLFDAGRDSGLPFFDGGIGPVPDGGVRPVPDGGVRPVPDSGITPRPDTGIRPVPDGGIGPDPDGGVRPQPDGGRPPFDAGFPGPDADIPDAVVLPDGSVPPDGGIRPPPDGGLADAGVPDGGIGCTNDLQCQGLTDACNQGFCDVTVGLCRTRFFRNGQSCDDGFPCTRSDRCLFGACVGVPFTAANNTCLRPTVVNLPVGSTVRTGGTECATDDEQGSCTMSGGRDVVYRFDLNTPRRVRITTEDPAAGTTFDTAVHVRTTCTDPVSERVCSDDAPGLGRRSRVDDTLESGTYFTFVDGANGAAQGPYQVRFDVDPQNTCAGATPLTLPAQGQTMVVRGTTSGGTNDFEAQCARPTAPDHVYTFTVSQPTRIRFETRSTAGQYDTALHIHRAPCTGGNVNRAFCDDDGGAGTLSMITETFSAGTWFVVVDGFSSSNGVYELAVTPLPPALPPFTVTFPEVGDIRLTSTSTLGIRFVDPGDLVEGNRMLPTESWTRAQFNLRVVNNLTCGILRIQPQFNRNASSTLTITPGVTTVTQTVNLFTPVPGGNTNIRLQVVGRLQAGCGWVELPNGVSSITFSTN